MESQSAQPTAATSAPLWYTVLRPDRARCELIEEALSEGQPISLEVRMEILELDRHGRALLWIHDANGEQPPRLAVARLSCGRYAEVDMAQAEGYRVFVIMEFKMLAAHPQGGYSALTCAPEGRLEVEAPMPSEDLSQLLG